MKSQALNCTIYSVGEITSKLLPKGAMSVMSRYFQVGLGLGEGLGFKISTAV